MPGIALDLHVHTTSGSADASLRVETLGPSVKAAGLAGVMTTEHFRQWGDDEVRTVTEMHGIVVIPAREWATPLGHILALGITRNVPEMRDPDVLRRAADAEGGLLIVAHPFRHFFDAPRQGLHPATLRTNDPEEAARLPIFKYVDCVEVINGNCTARENAFASAVADVLGLPPTAGSDAHYPEDVGRCWTALPAGVRTVGDVIAALRSRSQLVMSARGFDSGVASSEQNAGPRLSDAEARSA